VIVARGDDVEVGHDRPRHGDAPGHEVHPNHQALPAIDRQQRVVVDEDHSGVV